MYNVYYILNDHHPFLRFTTLHFSLSLSAPFILLLFLTIALWSMNDFVRARPYKFMNIIIKLDCNLMVSISRLWVCVCVRYDVYNTSININVLKWNYVMHNTQRIYSLSIFSSLSLCSFLVLFRIKHIQDVTRSNPFGMLRLWEHGNISNLVYQKQTFLEL